MLGPEASSFDEFYLYCTEFNGTDGVLRSNLVKKGSTVVVGKATCYGLDGPEIECRQGRDFPHPSRPALGRNPPPVQWVPVLFPACKTVGA